MLTPPQVFAYDQGAANLFAKGRGLRFKTYLLGRCVLASLDGKSRRREEKQLKMQLVSGAGEQTRPL